MFRRELGPRRLVLPVRQACNGIGVRSGQPADETGRLNGASPSAGSPATSMPRCLRIPEAQARRAGGRRRVDLARPPTWLSPSAGSSAAEALGSRAAWPPTDRSRGVGPRERPGGRRGAGGPSARRGGTAGSSAEAPSESNNRPSVNPNGAAGRLVDRLSSHLALLQGRGMFQRVPDTRLELLQPLGREAFDLLTPAHDTPSSRKCRMSPSLPSSRETPSEPFGRPSFRPENLARARPSRVRSEIDIKLPTALRRSPFSAGWRARHVAR